MATVRHACQNISFEIEIILFILKMVEDLLYYDSEMDLHFWLGGIRLSLFLCVRVESHATLGENAS